MQFSKKILLLVLLGFFSLNVSASLPIVKAVKNGDLDRLEKLVEQGYDVGVLVKRKYEKCTETLLHRAIYEDQYEIFEFLLKKFKEKGRNIDLRGSCCETPLMKACYLGLYEYVDLLIKNGADVNFDNGIRRRPFVYAAFSSAPYEDVLECFRLLKKAGAKFSAHYFLLDDLRELHEDMWPELKRNLDLWSRFKYWVWKLLEGY